MGIRYTEVARMDYSESLKMRFQDILSSGQLTNNKWTAKFESSFRETFSLKGQCIAVNGCQNGLFLTLVALGVHRPLLPDFTFCSTAHAAFYASRDFKVGDCDLETWNLIPKAKPECDAILGVHVFGNLCDHSQLLEVADELQVPLIYDAAHAIGASYKGIPAGDLGTASIFSLSPTKQIVASEGGMIVTSNKCLADKLRVLRNYGNEPDYDCRAPGLNARMSEIHSCLALESLSHFQENFRKRLLLKDEYLSEFPPEILQKTTPESFHAYKDLSILVGQKREKVQRALTEKQIEWRQYFRPISALTCYEGWQSSQPNAKSVFENILQLPIHPNLETDDVRRICKIVLREVNGGVSAIDASDTTLQAPAVNGVNVSMKGGSR